ncbi:MAG TPA: HAMP domain-containing sensor histidine kinase [Gaiellaceae bacterium]|nr:HAMP domain-containing sensor histidine kinase [Gaiellaceae bacterium]
MVTTPRRRGWLGEHRQRLAYLAIAVSLAAAIALAAVGGIFLHHSAGMQRQTLRTETLSTVAFQLQNVFEEANAARAVTAPLVAQHRQALADARAAFSNLKANDSAEAARLRAAYTAYLHNATSVFNDVGRSGGISAAEQQLVQASQRRLQAVISDEIARQAHATDVANPRARATLIAAAVAAGLVVVLLIWQFELERRAGRIDRDHAARTDELVRLRDDFVAIVSHELRTPLTSIIGYLELLMDDDPDNLTEEQTSYLATVQRSTNRLIDLVGDLLLVAEAERGPLALDRDEVDLRSLAQHAIDAARPAADAKDIDLTLTSNEAAFVYGDERRLGQVLDNLVSNAVKFTPHSGRVAARIATGGDRAVFEIADSGKGIPPDEQEQLFEPFFRSPTATARAIPGTGLGLSITKAIVDAHGGTIEVESTPGSGATFRIGMPALRAAEVLNG